ncbi:50S ribosomal protein L25 [bacterium]|nr:50S ribosomal protein L25 [bacterium]
MATVKLPARTRTAKGEQGAKHTRDDGLVPAVLYGEDQKTVSLAISRLDLRTALATPSGRNVIVQLGFDGDEITRAVIREMARDPLTREILHVDFLRISENKAIAMRVPVVLIGECEAVKEGRGILDHAMREVEIKCLPRDIPESIDVDVSELDVGRAIHVSELVGENIEFLDIPERPVVDVLQPTIYKVDDEDEEGVEDAEGAEGADGEAAGDEAKPDSEETAK